MRRQLPKKQKKKVGQLTSSESATTNNLVADYCLENLDSGSFFRLIVAGRVTHRFYGKIDTFGTHGYEEHSSEESANIVAEGLIKEKLGRGYKHAPLAGKECWIDHHNEMRRKTIAQIMNVDPAEIVIDSKTVKDEGWETADMLFPEGDQDVRV